MKFVHLSTAARVECKPSTKQGRYELTIIVDNGTNDATFLKEVYQARELFQFMPAAIFVPLKLDSVHTGTEQSIYYGETDVEPMLA